MEQGCGLLVVARDRMRTRYQAYRTEQQYLYWIRCYVTFHHRRHPRELGAPEVEQFLTHRAVHRKVGRVPRTRRCCSWVAKWGIQG